MGAAHAGELTDLPGPSARPRWQAPHTDRNPQVGIGVICNTSDQASQYVALRAKGQALMPAVIMVIRKARQLRACGQAAISFIRDRILDTPSR